MPPAATAPAWEAEAQMHVPRDAAAGPCRAAMQAGCLLVPASMALLMLALALQARMPAVLVPQEACTV